MVDNIIGGIVILAALYGVYRLIKYYKDKPSSSGTVGGRRDGRKRN